MDHFADSEALWEWNLITNRVHFSPRWVALLGCDDHEIGSTPDEWLQRVHPEDAGAVSQTLEAARNRETDAFECHHRLRHKNGTYRWMWCRGVVVRNDAGDALRLTGSHADVTTRTTTDPLTGLPNRLLLLDRLAAALGRGAHRGGSNFAVLLLGLERATGPGASRGSHDVAPLLMAIARRLETCLRVRDGAVGAGLDDLVAHVGNEQFVILLDGLKEIDDAQVVADRLLAEVLKPFTIGSRQVFAAASIGIALGASGYTRAEDVLRDAETAWHRARVLGGSHSAVFDTAALKSEQVRLQYEREMPAALERGDFTVDYQPIVSLASHQIVGFEALVRWQHPDRGVIPPADFIPIAERTGFIVPLGNWILRQACMQLRAWQVSVPNAAAVWMSVNLSVVQLKDPRLLDELRAILHECLLDPRHVVLELTEGLGFDNPPEVKAILMQLRAIGVRISIDDFGTGYSSLAYLRQFPVDALKIDRSFLRGIETQDDSATIVGTVAGMAHQLGLHVVVEGVENEQQLTLLHSLNCDSVQGYLFAKPLAAEAATAILTDGLPSLSPSPPADEARPQTKVSISARLASLGATRSTWIFASAAVAVLMTVLVAARLFKESAPVISPPVISPPEATATAVTATAPAAPSRPQVKDTPTVASSRPAVAPAAKPAVAPSQRTAERKETSLEVEHLHRFGSCRGRLVVSEKGLAFVADGKSGGDSFLLGHGEFLSSLANRVLTIKSSARTYRFKGKDASRSADGAEPLQALLASMARFR